MQLIDVPHDFIGSKQLDICPAHFERTQIKNQLAVIKMVAGKLSFITWNGRLHFGIIVTSVQFQNEVVVIPDGIHFA